MSERFDNCPFWILQSATSLQLLACVLAMKRSKKNASVYVFVAYLTMLTVAQTM
jgi:hypothetical protein